MQNKEQIVEALESNFQNTIQSSVFNASGQAIVDSLICGTILTLIEQSELELSAKALKRLKVWTDENAFASALDILPYPQDNDFRASLYKTFICFHNNGGKIFEEISRLGAARTEAEIANLRSTFMELITGILDSSIAALPQVQSIEFTEEEQSTPSQNSWREVITEEVTTRNRSDAQMAREQFTESLFEAADSAARVLTSEPDNVASYNAYIAQAEAILSNRETHLSIALDYIGHHNFYLHSIIGYRLKPQDCRRLFALLTQIEVRQIEAFLADHTNPDLQYIYESIKAIYSGSIGNWGMYHTEFTHFITAESLGLETTERIDAAAVYNVLASCIRQNNFDKVNKTCAFLKSKNLTVPDDRMGELISKLIASDKKVEACNLIEVTSNLSATDPVTTSSLLMQAALKYQPSVVRKLLESGANVNAQRLSDGKTVCHLLVETARSYAGATTELNSEKIIELLSILQTHGADVNIRDINGNTPLMLVLERHDRVSVSIKLIEMGAVCEMRNSEHFTALQQMCYSKHFNLKLANKILTTSGMINQVANMVDFGTLIVVNTAVIAIKSQHQVLDKLQFILRNCTRATTNVTFGNGNNYLHYSIINYRSIQSAQIINFLCKVGVDVNAMNHGHYTPLAMAGCNPIISDDVIVALLLNGANPNPQHSLVNTVDDLLMNHPTISSSLSSLLIKLESNLPLPDGFDRGQLSHEKKSSVVANINTILNHRRVPNTLLSPAMASPIALSSPSVHAGQLTPRRSGTIQCGKRKEKENNTESPTPRRKLGLE